MLYFKGNCAQASVCTVKENRRHLSVCSAHKKTASLKACVRLKGKLYGRKRVLKAKGNCAL